MASIYLRLRTGKEGKILSKVIFQGMGGLGNQLFQLAAALNLAREHEVFYFQRDFNECISSLLICEELRVTQLKTKRSKFASLSQRFIGLALRVNFSQKKVGKLSPLLIWILAYLSRLPLSLAFGRRINRVIIMNCLDSIELPKLIKDECVMVIGYFQNWRTTENIEVVATLKLLLKANDSQIGSSLKPDIKSLVLHFRLGDYIGEKFGILETDYYLKALELLKKDGDKYFIYAFSDDLELAKALHSQQIVEYLDNDKTFIGLKWVEEVNLTSFESWNNMREADSFVIANSSFSWWAARLSMNESLRVFAPIPWFNTSESPQQIIPPDWIGLQSTFAADRKLK